MGLGQALPTRLTSCSSMQWNLSWRTVAVQVRVAVLGYAGPNGAGHYTLCVTSARRRCRYSGSNSTASGLMSPHHSWQSPVLLVLVLVLVLVLLPVLVPVLVLPLRVRYRQQWSHGQQLVRRQRCRAPAGGERLLFA